MMSNFEFLKSFDQEMYEIGKQAEKQFIDGDYKISTRTIRELMEAVIAYIEKKEMYARQKNMIQRFKYLLKQGYINDDFKRKLEVIWEWTSDASHHGSKKIHDLQSTTARLQDIFFVVRWLYNQNNTNKIYDDFDLTKIGEKQEKMTRYVKHFFAISAVNGPSEKTIGKSNVLEIKVDSRTIPYMVLLHKFQDKVSNALYPAIYIYKNFGVAFTVYGKGGYCKDNWPKQIKKEKTTIESYFKESGQYDDVLRQNPKYNYFDNMYENVYKLSKLDEEAYKLITKDFEKIRLDLKKLREDI